jgi:small subunit ribosomal protein S8e
VKWRALRLDTGNYSWGSEAVTRKTRILDVVYNASNNELVRTQTLVKSAIVQVDAAPFKQWYLTHYGVEIGRKKKPPAVKKDVAEVLIYAKKVFFFNLQEILISFQSIVG